MLKKRLKIMFMVLLGLVAAAGIAAYHILSHPMFGKLPSGERLKRVQTSPNYADGSFVNRVPKPHMVEGVSMPQLAWDFLFKKKERSRPSRPLPTERPDLKALPLEQDTVVWLGHSSLYMHVGGRRFLVDPNFTRYASPFTWRTYSFDGTDLYTAADLPEIDYLLITHAHFDHLNFDTIVAIKDKVGKVVCGLGVGEHLEYWGVPADKITELDWDESLSLDDGIELHCVSAHHFSGRTLWRPNPTLWASYVLKTPSLTLFVGGDSGYGPHFEDIGKRFGSFDLVLLENGQYDPNWKYNHLHPSEALQAARDLGAKRLLPVHAGRFVLANHPWDEPYILLSTLHQEREFELATPKIGEPVDPLEEGRTYPRWWEGVDD